MPRLIDPPRLRDLRRAKRLGIRRVAELCDTTAGTYWRWEDGQLVPRVAQMPALAEALGTKPEVVAAIFYGEGVAPGRMPKVEEMRPLAALLSITLDELVSRLEQERTG